MAVGRKSKGKGGFCGSESALSVQQWRSSAHRADLDEIVGSCPQQWTAEALRRAAKAVYAKVTEFCEGMLGTAGKQYAYWV